MKDVLQSVVNFINFLGEYWTFLVAIALALYTLYKKTSNRLREIISTLTSDELTDGEKLQIIWDQVKTEVLVYCAKSEKDWIQYTKAGEIKRAEVIANIYDKHPELSLLMTKAEAEAKIDQLIEAALEEVRKVVREETQRVEDVKVELLTD